MGLADFFKEYFEEEGQEKTASTEDDPKNTPEASTEEGTQEGTQKEANEEEIEKLASQYVELGRQTARRDFAAFEKQAAAELKEAGIEIPEEPVDRKTEILNKMQSNPEYTQELIAKHAE